MLKTTFAPTFAFAFSLGLAACASGVDATGDERTAAGASPIIGGTSSPATEDATVLLYIDVGGGVAGCTGTLLAPNLVLTARHCTSRIGGGGHACNEQGNVVAGSATFGADYAPKNIHVVPGTNLPPGYATLRGPVGKKIFHGTDTSICKGDVALVVLDHGVDDPTIAPIRLDRRPATGESLTLVGWGLTEAGQTPSMRMKRAGVAVRRLGPVASDGQTGAIPPRFFEVGEGICSGDSGGPAYAGPSSAVVGVISQGGNGREDPNNEAAGCIGTDTRNLLAELTSSAQVIQDAAAEAGFPLWLEGQPNPRLSLAAFGAACRADADCASNVCLESSKTCSKGCFGANSCPADFQCASLVGTRDVCIAMVKPPAPDAGAKPRPGSANATDDAVSDPGANGVIAPPSAAPATKGGCAAAPGGPGDGSLAGLAAFALGALARVRRRRR